jgi:succinate-semialdehyde dehydrogenase/glutarate-semialdehyde dehydrogenase
MGCSRNLDAGRLKSSAEVPERAWQDDDGSALGGNGMKLQSIDPTNGELIETFDEISDADLEAALARARQTFRTYRRTSFAERAGWMRKAAQLLEGEKEKWARVMTQEMGKTYKAAVAEAEKCALACRYFAQHGERFLADEPIETEADKSYVRYLPMGPVLAVMPWNFPFWQVVRFAAPALMAGNVGLLKHASNVSRCALALQEIFRRAGFPAGAFQTLLMSSRRVADVIADERIKAVTLTGSDLAGSKVAEQAGKYIKKSVMELGGSDPFIVLPSADLGAAVRTAITARNLNNGQSCIAAKRFIVHAKVYDEFERRMVEGLERLKVGDPMREDIDVGPLATAQILETVSRQVDESVRAATSTRSRPSPRYRATHPPIGRRCSVRWPCSSRRAIWMRRSSSPTRASTAWARASGPTTSRNAGAASTSSRRARRSSMPWWSPTRACPLAA